MGNKKNVKVGDIVNVLFSVGYAHPLTNKVVKAEIIHIGGYNGKCIEAKTLELVHHPENPQGILCYDKYGKFLGFKTAPAYDEFWTGWVKEVIEIL